MQILMEICTRSLVVQSIYSVYTIYLINIMQIIHSMVQRQTRTVCELAFF